MVEVSCESQSLLLLHRALRVAEAEEVVLEKRISEVAAAAPLLTWQQLSGARLLATPEIELFRRRSDRPHRRILIRRWLSKLSCCSDCCSFRCRAFDAGPTQISVKRRSLINYATGGLLPSRLSVCLSVCISLSLLQALAI